MKKRVDIEPHFLFSDHDIHAVGEGLKATIRRKIAEMPSSDLIASDDDLIRDVVASLNAVVPVLGQEISYTEEDVDVDVSRDPRRMIFTRTGPVYVPGKQIVIHVPFVGNPEFFRVRPSRYTLSPPRAHFDYQELQLVYKVPHYTPFDVASAYRSLLDEIDSNLNLLRESMEIVHTQLLNIAREALRQRRDQLKSGSALIASLGLPMKTSQLRSTMASVAAKGSSASIMNELTWDAFLSHASEDKESIARELVKQLELRGYKIWFDESTLKIGDSLRRSIDHGLSNSRFGIVLLSEHFLDKHWPNHELDGLATREIGGKKVILPIWHEIGFDRVRQFSPTLADRLAAKTEDGVEKVISQIASALLEK